jgi:toxin ParE1/3/4
MSTNVIKTPQALADLAEQSFYIALRSEEAGFRFLTAAEQTFQMLAETPGLGRPWESPLARLAAVRVWRIKGFEKWLVFYRPVEGGVEILHVLHGARDIEQVLGEEPDESP